MVDTDTQPSAFEEKIDEMIQQLASKSAAKRREAAYFLGEAAAADAVPVLVDVYQKDKNASVRAAAAYSLGMYKAVEQALARGQEDHVVELLHEIEEEGKIGSRAPVGRSVKIVLGLLVALIVLGVIFLMRAELKARFFGSDKPESAVVADVESQYNLVKNDTRTLQTDLLNVIQNQPLSCIDFFNNPGPYTLDPVDASTYPDVANIVTQLNAAQSSLASAKARYDDACNNGAPFGAAEAQQTFQLLLPALQALDPLELALTQASAAQPTPTPAPPTAVPSSTVEQPTTLAATSAPGTPAAAQAAVTAEASLSPTTAAEIKAQLAALYDIIDTVTDTRGASTLLVQYWTDVQKSGSTQGCSITSVPDIPNNNVFIPEIDFQASPDLRDAVQLINSGLAALHTSWTNFEFACNSRNLTQVMAANLQNAQVAAAAFAAANVKLEMVQGGS